MTDLRQRVKAERRRLGNWSVRRAVTAGKNLCSNTSWSDWEKGLRGLGPKVQACVSEAFGWPPDWPDLVEDEPTMPDATGSQGDAWARVAELEAVIEALEELLAAQADAPEPSAPRPSPKRRRSSR